MQDILFLRKYFKINKANKAVKMTPRIPPKNGGVFNPGSVIRLEFPAQGYVNPSNTTLTFDVTMLYGQIGLTDTQIAIRFQNNVLFFFKKDPIYIFKSTFIIWGDTD
jgi:hypothetical protein